ITDAVGQAVAQLTSEGKNLSDNNGPNNCGPGLIVERAVEIMKANGTDQGVGLLDKPTGNGCNGHSVDVLAFPDGCIYDVIVGSGSSNSPGFSLICCGELLAAGGNGTCADRYQRW